MKLTEREKAYHDGYKQGRFDEYAERMGYDQAEKVKAKIDKQKNCLYCQKPFKKWNDGYWDNCQWQINMYDHEGHQHYELLGQVFNGEFSQMATITKFNYCPMCGRPLNEEEE
jgi:hypothetical protein